MAVKYQILLLIFLYLCLPLEILGFNDRDQPGAGVFRQSVQEPFHMAVHKTHNGYADGRLGSACYAATGGRPCRADGPLIAPPPPMPQTSPLLSVMIGAENGPISAPHGDAGARNCAVAV